MRLYILTGASQGIGASLAEQLLSTSNEVYCSSQTPNDSLTRFARMRQLALNYQQVDLSQAEDSLEWLKDILDSLHPEDWKEICLVLNAAVITPIHKIGKEEHLHQIKKSLLVNYVNPVMLSECFVKYVQDWNMKKQIMFIGSRASTKIISSFSNYCSSKAGLEVFAKILEKEQNQEPFPIRITSVHPGPVDTRMQEIIRAQPKEVVEEVEYYIGLKNNKGLLSPEIAACEIVKILQSEEKSQEVVIDLRKVLSKQSQ